MKQSTNSISEISEISGSELKNREGYTFLWRVGGETTRTESTKENCRER